ncbi:hypothetical protein BDZ45DRAFT_811489 [Acephala macrosclerotiorum]|nr:hypothetical protein BDZ45DRAFT_811489 [Acephala macrosclerotiorum]
MNVSVELTVVTLTAIEQAIGFFISNEGKPYVATLILSRQADFACEVLRGGKAILMRDEYGKGLLKSFREINTKSTKLMGEATKSHIREAHLEKGPKLTRRRLLGLSRDPRNDKADGRKTAGDGHHAQLDRALIGGTHESTGRSHGMKRKSLTENTRHARFDYVDITFILNKEEQLPVKQRAQPEQIINTPLFRGWIVSTSSTKLLV